MKNLRQLIKEARAAGNRVRYRVRRDGSVRVFSINGKRYSRSSSEGNNALRAMLGAPLSESRRRQLREATPYLPKKLRKAIYDENVKIKEMIKRGLKRRPIDLKQAKRIYGKKGLENALEEIKKYGGTARSIIPASEVASFCDSVEQAMREAEVRFDIERAEFADLSSMMEALREEGFQGTYDEWKAYKQFVYENFVGLVHVLSDTLARTGEADPDAYESILGGAAMAVNETKKHI